MMAMRHFPSFFLFSNRQLAFATVALALVTGCATTQPNEALEQARATYAEVQDNPHVTRFAPKELAQAGIALDRAEAMARDERDQERIAHQAYLAERDAQIARETAMARAARAEIARADEERRRIVLQARAEQARAEREQAQQRLEALQAEQQQRQQALARQRAALAGERDARKDLRQQIERLQAEVAELEMRQTERGLALTVSGDVLFDTGKSALKPGAHRAIEEFARVLRERPGLEVVVEGYTDSTGGEAFNRELSSARAHAVRWALVERGVDPKQVRARGMGEAFPVATNATAAGRQLNRRVEFVIPEGTAAAGGTEGGTEADDRGTPPESERGTEGGGGSGGSAAGSGKPPSAASGNGARR